MEYNLHKQWITMEYVKAVYCHPAYLTYMQSTSWEAQGWKKQIELLVKILYCKFSWDILIFIQYLLVVSDMKLSIKYTAINRRGFTGGSDGKESACNAGDLGLIPGLGRSPGEENGNPLQYSWLENFMDRGTWQATIHRVAKSWTWLSNFHFHFLSSNRKL